MCDPATAIGARDRAVVRMLVRLGLRAGEAARLQFDDIDWASGQIKVIGRVASTSCRCRSTRHCGGGGNGPSRLLVSWAVDTI